MELISARVPMQTVIDEAYKMFVNPVDYRLLPGVAADHFAFVTTQASFLSKFEEFEHRLLTQSRSCLMPRGGFVLAGHQKNSSHLTWDGERLPYLALTGCETMGLMNGGGYLVMRTDDLHPVISHMIYNNISFSEDELYGKKCLRVELGGGPYCPNANVWRAYVVNDSLMDATRDLHRWL